MSVSRSRSDIEDAHASANANCVKKRFDSPDGNLPSKSVVIFNLFPALPLKLLKAWCVRQLPLPDSFVPTLH